MDGPSENAVAGPASDPPSGTGLERLEVLLDQLAQDLGGLGPPESDGTGHLDPGLVAGPSPQAQENRAIHISRARLAADRAREARERIPGLVSQVQEGLAQIRARHGRPQADGEEISRALKAAMSEVTPAEDPDGSLRGVVRGAVAGIPSVDAATVALRDKQARLLRAIGSDAIAEALADWDWGSGA